MTYEEDADMPTSNWHLVRYLLVAFILVGFPLYGAEPANAGTPTTTVVFVADGLPAETRSEIKHVVIDGFLEQPEGTRLVYVRSPDHRVLSDVTLPKGGRASKIRAIGRKLAAAIGHLDDKSHDDVPDDYRCQLNVGGMPTTVTSLGDLHGAIRVVMFGSLVDHSPKQRQWSWRNHRVAAIASVTDPTSTSSFAKANTKPLPKGVEIVLVAPSTVEHATGETLIHEIGIQAFLSEWTASAAPESTFSISQEIAATWRPAAPVERPDTDSLIWKFLAEPTRAGVIELPREERRKDGDVGFFGIKAEGDRVAFCIDRSGSMKGACMTRAKSELTASLSRLPSGTHFRVYFYDDAWFSLSLGDDLIEVNAESVGAAKAAIGSVSTGGSYCQMLCS